MLYMRVNVCTQETEEENTGDPPIKILPDMGPIETSTDEKLVNTTAANVNNLAGGYFADNLHCRCSRKVHT